MRCSAAASCAPPARAPSRTRHQPRSFVTGLIAARRFVVSGKVQGVFFRASTARMAEKLNLRGFARNLPDGRVEVLAVGEVTALESLSEWLQRGPARASVTAVVGQHEDAGTHQHITDFRTE